MSDPLGLIGNLGSSGAVHGPHRGIHPGAPGAPGRGADVEPGEFRRLLELQIEQVNELQRDAKEAVEDAVAGRRDDVEGVILAAQKADTAFRMLLQVRNKMMEAYEEVKQIRV